MSKVSAQILSEKFLAIALEGSETFVRMARSPLVSEEGQYACAVLDGHGRLIAQNQGEPSQLVAVQATLASILDTFAFNIADGDVILCGDPYCGGTFSGLLTLVVPVPVDGELPFFVAIRFATGDLAGNVPGLFQPDAHEIWQEAFRITPVKLVRDGSPQKDVRRYILKNSRTGDQLDGDLSAAAATAHMIAGRLSDMAALVGLRALQDAADYRITYARARMLGHLQSISSGDGTAQSADGSITVKVRVASADEALRIGFEGTSACPETPDNLTTAATRSVVLLQLAGELVEDIGLSQGIIDAIELELPAGSCVHPVFPTPVSLGWRSVAPLVCRAIADATGGCAAMEEPVPMLVVFEQIGTRLMSRAVLLSPGFMPLDGAAGGDASSGRRQLGSAERFETEGSFRLQRREFDEHGIAARVTVQKGGFEAIVVPGAAQPPTIAQTQPLERERSNVLTLAPGAEISFAYPFRQEGGVT